MLLALEGIDGSGKQTQAKLLADRARSEGFSTAFFTFPAYETNVFGALVGDYLNGEFGTVDEVSPKLSAILYAADRFESKARIHEAISGNALVVCDRYVPSNLAHQSAKLPAQHREHFVNWLSNIEYNIFNVPRPDFVVYLDVPVDVASTLVARKSTRQYTTRKADIHETDDGYLQRCCTCYALVMAGATEPWLEVKTTRNGHDLREPRDIHEDIWKAVRPYLVHQAVK